MPSIRDIVPCPICGEKGFTALESDYKILPDRKILEGYTIFCANIEKHPPLSMYLRAEENETATDVVIKLYKYWNTRKYIPSLEVEENE